MSKKSSATAGRKAIPIELKKIRGTYRKDRDKNTPKPSKNKPLPPKWLNKRAKQLFWHFVGRLKEINLDSRTYTEAIALLACRAEELERFDKLLNSERKDTDTLESNPYVYVTYTKTGDKIIKTNPIVGERERAARHYHNLLVEFGLTGASAGKISVPAPRKEKDDFSDF